MDVPDADEVDVDVDGERLLERGRLLPPELVVPREHLVRERNLLMVARGQESNLVHSISVLIQTLHAVKSPYEPCQPELEQCKLPEKTRRYRFCRWPGLFADHQCW